MFILNNLICALSLFAICQSSQIAAKPILGIIEPEHNRNGNLSDPSRTNFISSNIDLSDLELVKKTLKGKWERRFRFQKITQEYWFFKDSTLFKDSTIAGNGRVSGKNWVTGKYWGSISTFLFFTLVREHNKTIIRWHDIGGTADYEIIKLSEVRFKVRVGKYTWRYHRRKRMLTQ